MPQTAPAPIPSLAEAFGYFRRLVFLVRPFWGPLLRSILLGLLLSSVGLITPYISKLLIDEVYPTRDVRLLHVLVGAMFGISVSLGLLGTVRGYFGTVVASRLSNATVLMFFNHLQHLKPRFYDEHRVGEVMSRFGDVRSSLGSVTRVIGIVLSTGTYFVLVPPLLLILDPRLALVAMISMPFTISITFFSSRLLRKYWKRSTEAYADLNAFQIEALSHIRTVKTLALESHVFRRVRQQMEDALRLQLQATGLGQMFGTLNGMIGALGTAVFTWFSWGLILREQLTLGEFVAFSAYAGYLFQPIGQWMGLVSGFQQTSVRLGRMFEYIDTPTEQDAQLVYENLPPLTRAISGELALSNVMFGYSAEKTVLRDISIKFAQGSFTAVVGRSGAGKSTLLRLLCRMDDPQQGRVLIDGIRADQIPLRDLRRQIGVVWQDAALFQGTLWDNLTVGMDFPDRADVEEAVRVCGLADFVAELPAGFETPIAEWGASLSAGQKQRVALARVLVRETPVLLLDEATANIDLTTEAEILASLAKRLEGRTVILVTHRIATAALAERICVLDGGRVAGLGSQAELLNDCSVFRAMHEALKDTPDIRHLRVMARGG